VSLPAYGIAPPYGLVVFCWARLFSAQVNNLIAYRCARTVLKLPARFLWERVKSPVLGCLIMTGGVYLLQRVMPSDGIGALAAAVIVGAGLYAGALRLLDPAALAWGGQAFRKIFARQTDAIPPI